MHNTWGKILVVGGEGGTLTLFAFNSKADEWQYSVESNEAALLDLLNDEHLSEFTI